MLKKLYNWSLSFADKKHCSSALSFLSFIESIFFPIPIDPLLMVLGTAKPKKSPFYAFLASIFSVLGGLCGYFLGYYLWGAIGPFFLEYVFSPELFDKMMEGFKNNAFLSIFLAGFTPLPFKVFTLSAGVAQLPLLPFLLASLLSRSLRFMTIGFIFYFFGSKIKDSLEKHFEKITLVVGVLIILAVILYKFMKTSS